MVSTLIAITLSDQNTPIYFSIFRVDVMRSDTTTSELSIMK